MILAAPKGLVHVMSPTAVAVLLLAALVVDWMSVGPNSIRDRLAFLMGMTAIDAGKDAAKGSYIAGAITAQLLGACVLVLAIFAIGCLMPDRFSKKMGRWAAMSFPSTGVHRMNWKLWACAFFLGLLSDLPVGWGGDTLRTCVDFVGRIMAFIPNTIFGVS